MDAKQYLETCDPEAVLDPDAYRVYRAMLEGIWPHMVTLNTNIYLLSKIRGFPFGFLGIDPQPCWTAIQRALLDGCVLAIWRIVLDTQRKGCTLLHVKNHLLANLSDPRARLALAEVMKQEFSKGWQADWGTKVEEIRHSYVAHYDLRKHSSPLPEEIEARSLTFAELSNARDEVTELFDLLTLGVEYMAVPPEYDPAVVMGNRADHRNDIEKILDSLAQQSHLVNLPETNPALWRIELARMSPDDRERLNRYRRKFGLSEA